MARERMKTLIDSLGGRFSSQLGIDLAQGSEAEVFKWFLASILFGARIGGVIAANTYRRFVESRIISVDRMLEAGWDRLVEVLDSGGYVRYDFKTADKLLLVMRSLKERYGGELNQLHREASGPRDLEERVKGLGKGIGDVTANIFLRELRDVWEKASPLPQEPVILAARNLGLVEPLEEDRSRVLVSLYEAWEEGGVEGWGFPDFEAALLRVGRDFCRKARCPSCPLKAYCTAPRA